MGLVSARKCKDNWNYNQLFWLWSR